MSSRPPEMNRIRNHLGSQHQRIYHLDASAVTNQRRLDMAE